MHVGHKVTTSYSISRTDGALCRLAEADEEKELGVILKKRSKGRKTMYGSCTEGYERSPDSKETLYQIGQNNFLDSV